MALATMGETGGRATSADPAAMAAAIDWREQARHAALRADVSLALAEPGEPRAILQRCAEALVAHLDAAFARIWTVAPGGAILELQASAGRYTHLDGPHGRIPIGHLKIGLIAAERRPYLTNAVIGDPRVHEQGWARREGMIAFAGYPLIVEARLVGVMALFAQRPLGAPTVDALGSVAAAIGQGIERQRAERLLREREAAYRGIFEATSDGVLISDSAGRVVAANPAAGVIFGHPEAAWPRQFLADLIAPTDHDELRRVLTAGAVGQCRAQLGGRRMDGQMIPLEVGCGPLDYRGQPHLLWTIRDITERVEAERLREARVRAERQRLARDLHDSVAQSLYGVTLQAAAASRHLSAGATDAARESLEEIAATAREALAEMRLLLFDLRPPILAEVGLIAALRARLGAVEGRVVGLVAATFDAPTALALPPAIEEAFYRVAQEALNNVIKHAGARRVAVRLWQEDAVTGIQIADDGAGFEPILIDGGGLGLRGMAERAAQIGGRLTVDSTPGAGTTVALEVAR